MEELNLRKCKKCGALIEVLKDCTCDDCGIICCGEQMNKVLANSTDASFEKHVPNYEIDGDMMNIHVDHVMESDHYIEWIMVKYKKETRWIYFNPNDKANYTTYYEKDAIIYAYCNKHGLWSKVVE